MSVSTKHPEYIRFAKIWHRCQLAIDGQSAVHHEGIKCLKPTSGMRVNWDNFGAEDYDAYKERARFSDLPSESLQGAMGVLFGKVPKGDYEAIVTSSGGDVLELLKSSARAAYTKGRHVLVIEAPENGGDAYIAEYPAECLINWREDENGNLSLAVFEEQVEKTDDEYSHETVKQWRVYTPDEVRLYDQNEDLIESYSPLIAGVVPVVVVGSIDNTISPDMPSVNPIAECCFSAYKLSADYMQALHLIAQPTPYQAGVTPEQYNSNIAAGLGAGACWYLGDDPSAKAGYIEYNGNGTNDIKTAIDNELEIAAGYSVKLTQVQGVETATSKQIRDKAQKSSLQILAEAVSSGVNKAIELLPKPSGQSIEPVEIQIEDSETAEATMITAIGNRVNAGTYPPQVEFNYAKKAGLYKGTYEEWLDEQQTGGTVGFGE